jgi:biotin carboxylase
LEDHIKEAVRAIGIDFGAAHVELATTKDGFVLFELGARCGGGGTPEPIVPFVTGVDEFVETVRILSGDAPVNLKPKRNNGCSYHFITPKAGI